MKKVRRDAWVWEEVKRAQKKKSRLPITTQSNYNNNSNNNNNNKHNIKVFYKKWKKYNEIQ